MDPEPFARRIDHTILKPEATARHVERVCDEARRYRFHSVFVNPVFVPLAVKRLDGSDTTVGTVAGFPLGASDPATIVDEARRAVQQGAREVDMVAWIGGLIAGEYKRVADTIHQTAVAVHQADSRNVLKVILETAALSEEQIVAGCRCCAEGEADFVKTSTGFHPSGGATVEHVRLLHKHASPIKVKAAGGIRDAATAMALIDAGAARLGTSAGVAIYQQITQMGRIGDSPSDMSARPKS